MAKAVSDVGAVFVHVSSDYVFAGDKDFFTEDDIPDPKSIYGQSKLAGEEQVRKALNKYYLVRTSSVFGVKEGKQKKNFVDTIISKAKAGEPLKVVNDQIMSPTYSYDLASKINELIEKPADFDIYHITNQGSCSWYEFALKTLELMGIKASIVPITTAESGTKVNRPKRSVLKNAALAKQGIAAMSPWQDALERYLREKYKI
jgi:dTDP-4-dehydrorhamnose reductase